MAVTTRGYHHRRQPNAFDEVAQRHPATTPPTTPISSAGMPETSAYCVGGKPVVGQPSIGNESDRHRGTDQQPAHVGPEDVRGKRKGRGTQRGELRRPPPCRRRGP